MLFLKRNVPFPDIMVVPQITHLVINYKKASYHFPTNLEIIPFHLCRKNWLFPARCDELFSSMCKQKKNLFGE